MKKLLFILGHVREMQRVQAGLARNCRVDTSLKFTHALQTLATGQHEFVFFDIHLLNQTASGSSVKAVFQTITLVCPNTRIIVMTPGDEIKAAVNIVHEGAASYLSYPLVTDEILLMVKRQAEKVRTLSELDYLREQVWQEDEFNLLQTRSPAMKRVFEKIQAVAATKSTVLLTGETGTGKGYTARFIHRLSLQKTERFIEVHCGAIPDTLVESEMFGHEKGAFTGAIRRKLGKFELAGKGTIFLDEIGTITAAAQIKLLQVLQNGIFHRVGSEEDIQADTRIIGASNTDLKNLCDAGRFRPDLYYRLNVFPIELPPLKERKEDIPLLVELLLAKLNTFHSKAIDQVHPRVLQAFLTYAWPGNIRELENLLERAYILETSGVLMPENFPMELFSPPSLSLPGPLNTQHTLSQVRQQEIARVERAYLDLLLKKFKGKINATAAGAGITTRQIHKLMKKYDLRKEDYKREPTH